jgi:hypothetical protein
VSVAQDRAFVAHLRLLPDASVKVGGERRKTRDEVAVLGGCSERVSAVGNSLIRGKIQGISVETPLPALHSSLKRETALVEFPAIETGKFLLRTGKKYRANSETRMTTYWHLTDIDADAQ